MKIGCVKEVLEREGRVGLTPKSVKKYVDYGHEVLIENYAGLESGFTNEAYQNAGAYICQTAEEVWTKSDMIVKVKEPKLEEYKYFRENMIIYTYFHLASNKALTQALLNHKVTAIAYESIETSEHRLPCLEPMSIIAGRLSVMEGSKYLQNFNGGMGLSIVDANVLIIGAGIAGTAALEFAVGLKAKVTIIDIDETRLEQLKNKYQDKIATLISNEENIKKLLVQSHLVISTVLIPGAHAPKLIKKSYYKHMIKGSVIVDVAIDQGGSTEVSRPTRHDDPVFIVDDIIHYCVANMPGSVARSATMALNKATLKYGLEIANKGNTLKKLSSPIIKGINIYQGRLMKKELSDLFELPYL